MLNNITAAVLETVSADRREEEIDADLLKKIVSIYTFLSRETISGATTNCLLELENKMLEASRAFYSNRAQQMIETYTLVEYLQQADLLLEAEKSRIEKYLCWPNFDKKLLTVFQQEILVKNQIRLLNCEDGGIKSLFQNNNFEALKLLYKLYNPIEDGLKPVAEKFKQ